MAGKKLDVAGLYAALDQKRQAEEISWREVARQSEVSPSTLTRMSLKPPRRPDVDSFAALVGWLGVPAERFLDADENPQVDTLAVVSTYLRGDKNLSEETTVALEDILSAAYKRLRKIDESSSRFQKRS
jgi:transcriptional regulator with XRE-family HTH domain